MRATGAAITLSLRALSTWDRMHEMFSSIPLSAHEFQFRIPPNTNGDVSRGNTIFLFVIAFCTSESISQEANENSLRVTPNGMRNER